MDEMVLDKISRILYGLVSESDMVGCYYGLNTDEKIPKWNFFVFRRAETKISGKTNGARQFQTDYEINILHENFIPEGYVEKVIQALESSSDGPKLKVKSEKIDYAYNNVNNTDKMVEIAHFVITRPEKRY